MLTSCLLLAALGVAVFPCWRYSATWGHGPSIAVGGLLLFMAALTVSGKPWQRAGAVLLPAPAELSVALPVLRRESSPRR